MAKKRFIIQYQDGSRKQVGRLERDSMILAKEISHKAENRYLFTGQAMTFHSFADLQQLIPALKSELLRRYLAGFFIWELGDLREDERLQTPEAQIERLEAMGWRSGAPV